MKRNFGELAVRTWLERLREQWHNVFSPHVTPRDIALGMAIGTLIGMTPLFGLHTILAVVLTTFLKASRAGAIFMSWLVSNPFTFLPVYLFAYRLGNGIFQCGPDLKTFEHDIINLEKVAREQGHFVAFKQLFADLDHGVIALSAGGLFVGLAAATLVYFCALPLARRVQTARALTRQAADPSDQGRDA